mmetsp:Transcript_7696/g.10084  ORF Transcript_7696/g.10084 Transcript_7696/m.10084 type:complete len:495 (+) Transcript_7696:56-1540(+)
MSNRGEGVNWPLDESDEHGSRKTTGTVKKVWISAVENASKSLAEKVANEKKWRQNYHHIVNEIICEQAKDKQNALSIAENGLKEVYNQFTFIRDGKELLLKDAMETYTEDLFESVEFSGSSKPKSIDFGITVAELKDLAEKSEIEPDVADSMKVVLENSESFIETLKDTWFVLLGSTSELCPLKKLLELGLNVVAISRPSPKRQAKVIQLAKESSGKLIVPVRKVADKSKETSEICGADVTVDTPELRTWLLSLKKDKRLVIGSYIYLDGAAHVLASCAMDAIVKDLVDKRPGTALAYLMSPSTVYPIPAAAAEDAKARYDEMPFSDSVLSALMGPFKPNCPKTVLHDEGKDSEKSLKIHNGLANFQGPSYALAKTIQNWRCSLARESTVVSSNITPSCCTESVFHVAAAARVLRGMKYRFAPLTYYEPEWASNLMTALLIYDLCYPDSPANPQTHLDNPLELFSSNGVHSGFWRSPYESETIGKAAYFYGIFN